MTVTNRAPEHELAVRYLLGDLPEAQAEKVEERYVCDQVYFQFIRETEDDLIGDYLRELLCGTEREKFEQSYLANPAQRQKVEQARQLREAALALRAAGSRRPFWLALAGLFREQPQGFRFAAALASLAVVTASAWLVTGAFVGQRSLHAQLESQRKENKRLSDDLRPLMGKPGSTPGVLSFLIAPGVLRDRAAQGNQLLMPSEAHSVELRLEASPPEEHSGFRASIQNIDTSAEVWSGRLPRAQKPAPHQVVVVPVDASRLANGDYILFLYATLPGGSEAQLPSYSFSIRRN